MGATYSSLHQHLATRIAPPPYARLFSTASTPCLPATMTSNPDPHPPHLSFSRRSRLETRSKEHPNPPMGSHQRESTTDTSYITAPSQQSSTPIPPLSPFLLPRRHSYISLPRPLLIPRSTTINAPLYPRPLRTFNSPTSPLAGEAATCWTCNESLGRKEGRVRYGWSEWHWGCVGCLVCRVCHSLLLSSLRLL